MSPSSNHIQSTTKYLKYYIIFPLNSINIFGDKIIVLHILPYFPSLHVFIGNSKFSISWAEKWNINTRLHINWAVSWSFEQSLRGSVINGHYFVISLYELKMHRIRVLDVLVFLVLEKFHQVLDEFLVIFLDLFSRWFFYLW